jgi:Ubiquitin-activating enzyme E1 four-helix bundle/Ubiquitin-activating enzyme E1 FCCH domain
MKVKEGKNSETKLDSINGSIHKVKVINPQSFRILSDTSKLEPYVSGGVAKHLKTKVKFSFKDFSQTYTNLDSENVPLDPNLAISDFEKMDHNLISHICFLTLDRFRISNQGRLPKPWDLEDAIKFVEMAKEEGKKTDLKS